MSMLRNRSYFTKVHHDLKWVITSRPLMIKTSECIKGVWCHINETTFSVMLKGKSHRIYTSAKLPKFVVYRGAMFC